ncbi:MAG: PilZ domain-containing protein [Alphaproteobacteria bacterium]
MTQIQDSSHGRRRYERKHVLLAGRFMRGAESVSCLVTDISANGARIMLDRCPGGDRLGALQIDRFGLFAGELRWAGDGSAGIRFLDRPNAVAAAVAAVLPFTGMAEALADAPLTDAA